jgi:ElaB/YqjD/DUF883 family membrane-anchored ribosome-binding protein
MAEEIRVTGQGRAEHAHRAQLNENAEVEATIEPHPSQTAPVPDDPEAARAEIQMTRSRMSETIDEIEDVLLRKKERIQDRLDVFAPVRQRPLPSVGIALGAGVLLGLLTGGDDEDEWESHGRDRYRSELRELEERAETWEHRARRLLRIAREQEQEIEHMAGSRFTARAVPFNPPPVEEVYVDRDDLDDEFGESRGGGGSSVLDKVRDQILGALSGYVHTAVEDMVRSKMPSQNR